MSRLIPHDHPSIDSYRIPVGRHGGRRLRLEVAAELLPDDDVVRLILDETIRFAPVVADPTADECWLTGAYDGPSVARTPAGAEDHLQAWLAERGIDAGRTVFLDVIAPAYAFGVREPGTDEHYPDVEAPSSSLADIARSLEDD